MYIDESDVYTTLNDWLKATNYRPHEIISITADEIQFNVYGFLVVYEMDFEMNLSNMYIGDTIVSHMPVSDLIDAGEDLIHIWDELDRWFLLCRYANS